MPDAPSAGTDGRSENVPCELPVVRVNVFPGGFNWGLYVAADKGFFARQGIAVAISATPNSVSQMTDLAQGKCDIAMTAVDNIVAYVEGQGEAPIGPQPEFFAFMGSDSGFLSLVAASTIKEISDLSSKAVSVDALTTGYAFVLFEILRRHKLDRDSYAIKRVGGMIQRYDSLIKGNEAATMLSAPYNLLAKELGLNELIKATEVLGPYQGNVAAARRSWASANADKVIAFVRGYVEAITWLYDARHPEEAIAVLLRNLPQMSQRAAEASYSELLDPRSGFFRDCNIDLAGMTCVLQLRSRYGEPRKHLDDDPMKYCDLSYYKRAVGH